MTATYGKNYTFMTTHLKRLLILFFIHFPLILSAQEFYISAGGGYALGIEKSRYYSWGFSDVLLGKDQQVPLELEELSPGNTVLRNNLFSYGKGANAQLTLGYMFNKHIGIDLRLSYLFSQKISPLIARVPNTDIHAESKASAFLITPSLTLTSGTGKLAPYAKAGFILGVPTVKSKTFFNLPGTDILIEDKVFGGVAFGISTSIGIKYFFDEKTALFGEVNYINLTFNPSKRTIVTATQNGTDVSGVFYPDGTDISLKKNFTLTPSTPETEQSTHPLPFSGIGMNLGVLFSFK